MRQNNTRQREIDFLVFILIFAFGLWASLQYNLAAFWCGILTTVVPAFYLTLRTPKNLKKIAIGTLVLGGLNGLAFSFLASYNGSWFVPKLVIPGRILGVLPWDDLIGWMMMTYMILTFYDHFLNNHSSPKISKRAKWVTIILLVLCIIILTSAVTGQNWLHIPYFYAIGGSLAMIMPVVTMIYNHALTERLLKLTAMFFFVWFAIEIVAVLINGWTYPGQYIGQVALGGVSFPIEELLFWMLFYATTVASYYEYFFDDNK